MAKTLLKKLTPVLMVDAIEPCLAFWVDRLGFKKTIEVPEGNHLGFVALERDGIEIMVQTHTSALTDMPQLKHRGANASLYLEVTSLADIERALEGLTPEVRRKAPYGAEELFIHEPGGHLIGFAQQP